MRKLTSGTRNTSVLGTKLSKPKLFFFSRFPTSSVGDVSFFLVIEHRFTKIIWKFLIFDSKFDYQGPFYDRKKNFIILVTRFLLLKSGFCYLVTVSPQISWLLWVSVSVMDLNQKKVLVVHYSPSFLSFSIPLCYEFFVIYKRYVP